MPLDAILNHIINESNAQREKMTREAKTQSGAAIHDAQKEAEVLYKEVFDREKSLYERNMQRLIVSARLEAKKDLLEAKQELIDDVFEKVKQDVKKVSLKKQQITPGEVREVCEDVGFYIKALRADYEAEIAKILFQ